MSLQAPKSYWDYRSLIDCINEDSIVTIMKMSKNQLTNRVTLIDTVLDSHNKGRNFLSGKLDENMVDCIRQYKDMLTIMQKNPLEFDVPKNRSLGMGGGLRSYIS